MAGQWKESYSNNQAFGKNNEGSLNLMDLFLNDLMIVNFRIVIKKIRYETPIR